MLGPLIGELNESGVTTVFCVSAPPAPVVIIDGSYGLVFNIEVGDLFYTGNVVSARNGFNKRSLSFTEGEMSG